MIPNKNNFCGGNYDDWFEVMLTEKCNGGCNWCIEKNGYHPKKHASAEVLVNKILNYPVRSGKLNVILLGGEPTLYKDMFELVNGIKDDVDIYVTTNGSMITEDYIEKNLKGVKGINISIHHYDLSKNQEITKIQLNQEYLEDAIVLCRRLNIGIRFNCNVIKGYIDSGSEILKFVQWAKETGADKIRFAELKNEQGQFIDLAKIMNYRYGLNDNPYIDGCNKDAVINDIPVNFRQMCGLQTPLRQQPINPKCIYPKKVLYYDGEIYNGWQTKGMEVNDMTDKEIRELIQKSIESALKEIVSGINKQPEKTENTDQTSGFGCWY